MSFIQDPRVRQRWNQISHNAEAVTENAAAGIWSFQHRYINPCLGSVADAFDSCTGVCFGDREERARRARERDRGARRTRAEYTFDFYDDWEDADDEGPSGSGILGGWSGGRREDWDRLLAGTGNGRSKHTDTGTGAVADQPRRKRGMSYGTRGLRRKGTGEEDPNVIPRTAPLGFLGRLPFKIGGTLRYKPSAANLQDHPGAPAPEHERDPNERQPLLGTNDNDGFGHQKGPSPQSRPRSNTTGSGETSSSYRSRGDLFPSDGEGDEDAVPLDDEFAMALDRVDDRSSNRTRSSKGKRPADGQRTMSRTISRSTMDSAYTIESLKGPSINPRSASFASLGGADTIGTPGFRSVSSLEDLKREEEQAEREEQEEIERRRRAASQLAQQRGLTQGSEAVTPDSLVARTGADEQQPITTTTVYDETKDEMPPVTTIPTDDVAAGPEVDVSSNKDTGVDPDHQQMFNNGEVPAEDIPQEDDSSPPGARPEKFVPARLPFFG
ncbi:hypothetical protein QBC37DRAFT_109326 [Rhypophila decipiens]|uniref:Uncharacterized protein n=1 Tax=Rhypophila decipiens TaxID=261697 RepID=A0AAN7BDS2_9PEZI|nr:hypothetical protein QBC37DRAFT_109326 [Rhypophila decipiens]